MNKEPIGLYVFRLLMGMALLGFMFMLYWSSTLIESNIREINNEIFLIRKELARVQVPQKGREPRLNGAVLAPEPVTASDSVNSLIDSSIENLLKPDPFYEETLPELLGADFRPHGTFRRASIAKPENLHPFSNWSEVSQWNALCGGTVAQSMFGKYETLSPNFAYRVEERNVGEPDHEFWVFLRDDLYWEPLDPSFFDGEIQLAPHFLKRHPVTAHDFKFYFDAIMNPFNQESGALALRSYLGDIAEIKVIDDKTFVVRWKIHVIDGEPRIVYNSRNLTGALRPLAGWVYKYFADGSLIVEDDSDPETYRSDSVWAQNFAQHWAKNIIPSCGAWIFAGMNDQRIKFRRNENYFEPLAALGEEIEVRFKQSPDNVWQDFKGNKLDSYTLQPNQLIELEDFLLTPQYNQQDQKGAGIERLDYVVRSYSYIGWNQAKPYFQSKRVRQALTMAIDRERIIRQNLNGMGIPITGTFFRYSPSYDPSIPFWPFDPERAKLMLAEEGWYDSDGDGILDKEIHGKKVPFRFSLTYYVKNPTTKAVCEYISTALRDIGIDCKLNGVDIADLTAAFEDKSFDAINLAWALGTPPEDPKQLWFSTGARERGSSNAVGFVNERADEIIKRLEFERDPAKRIELYHEFDRIIHEEQPYTFLYTPKAILLYRQYLKNVFIPKDRQDLIPGADVAEPDSSIFYLDKPNMIEKSEFQQSRRLDFEPGKAGGDLAGFKGQDAGKDENRFFSHMRYERG